LVKNNITPSNRNKYFMDGWEYCNKLANNMYFLARKYCMIQKENGNVNTENNFPFTLFNSIQIRIGSFFSPYASN
jgi:hypothetical protein